MRLKTIFMMAIPAVLCFIGCQRLPDRPEGMPELTPCIIEVTFGGERQPDVGVLLKPNSAGNNDSSAWPAGGKTDAEGKAVMMTATHYRGVVPGEYVISFEKYAPEELRSDGMPLPAKSLLPLKYSQRQSTETVTVTNAQGVYSFVLEAL
ncbi:MAG: hypothetical protein FWD31_13395 [Planctomycetaceae bacterium]|nr:hypothetical protein [Planctomycetaceae bacterium]